MKNKFTIGEMSKLHKTPVKTLRYYDEIDLFKPAGIDEHNGYRYYATEQFEQLNIINYLKALGVPLKDIKSQLEHRNFDEFVALLVKQREITAQTIRELERIERRIVNRIEELRQVKEIKELGVVTIQTIPERKIVELRDNIFTEHQLEISLRKLEGLMSNMTSSAFVGRVGLKVSLTNIRKNKFDEYSSVFILLEEKCGDDELVTVLPEAGYACVHFNGNHSQSPRYYHMLLAYIKEHGFEINGDSIERTIVDQFISKNNEDYLTEIQIPIIPLTLQ